LIYYWIPKISTFDHASINHKTEGRLLSEYHEQALGEPDQNGETGDKWNSMKIRVPYRIKSRPCNGLLKKSSLKTFIIQRESKW